MPMYDYKCKNKNCECFDKLFEIKQSIKEDKLTQCLNCKEQTLEKQISKSSFILKGVGVYKNSTY